jgi:hypothetical protein
LLVHRQHNQGVSIMKMNSLRAWALTILASVSAIVVAAPPQPRLAVAPNGIKQLRFSWSPVTGATSYELWFQANPSAAETRYFQMPSSQTNVINNVAVHLLDWNSSRYWLRACDSSGCTASGRISVINQMAGTIGLLTNPSVSGPSQFGYHVALSDDGNTLAVVAPFESTSDPAHPEGSVYIYRRSGNTWPLQQSIPLDVAGFQGSNPSTARVRLSLNAAGNVLAVGLPGDHHGFFEGQNNGTVKVFRLIIDTGWRQEAIIAPETGFEFSAADWVELDDAGETLAVKTPLGTPGNPSPSVFIYTYDRAGSWSHTATSPGIDTNASGERSCNAPAFSGDGKVLAYACGVFEGETVFEIHAAPDWGIRDTLPVAPGEAIYAKALSSNGDVLAVTRWSSASNIRTEIWRSVSGEYVLETTLRAGNWQPAPATAGPGHFGAEARFSTDGNLLAISDPTDQGAGTGSLAPPLTAGTKPTGAVYVYDRRAGGWTLRRVVKPGRAGAAYETGGFGSSISLGDNGRTLAVGHPTANGNSGVAWLY